MKRTNLITLLAIILLSLMLTMLPFMAACAKPAPAPAPTPLPTPTPTPTPPPTPKPPVEVIKISSANFFPPVHRFSIMMDELGKEIEKRTNGRVEISYYPGGSLLTAPKMLDGVISEIADMGHAHIAYTRGRFPITEVMELPLGYPSSWVATHVGKDFYDKYKPKDWDDVHIILWHVAASSQALHTTKKPVRKLEDLKGLMIRACGRVGDTFAALGASPRDVPMAETYEALSKGVLDGMVGASEILKGWKFAEVCKCTTFCWQVGTGYVFYIIMNKDKWNSLPKDIQQIITEVGEDYRWKYGLAWNELSIEGLEYTLSLGNEIIELTPEEAARWRATVEPVVEKYVEDMTAAGFSEKEVRGWIELLRERMEYWTEKESELGITTELEWIKSMRD